MRKLKNITPISEDFGRWFTDVVTQGNLIEYGPAKGSIIFKPISYGIWENIQLQLNREFKKIKVQNVYLPLLIPESYIKREKEHLKGFAPELATVTRVGEKELSEHYVIRPTSEMLFGELFQKEINSYNDLPILYNQWANVLRWEKTTNPFLRTSEFLWQEGHTVHASEEEANEFSLKLIRLYETFLKDYLALPVLVGQKTDSERFAGAVYTYTVEAMMKDGKALQAGTSHYLGQNFAKAMNIKFKDKNNDLIYGYQTSWGVSTRLIGAIIMAHGDDRGIIIPPRIAPYQIDLLELFAENNPLVKETSKRLYEELETLWRVRLDDSSKNPGFKAGQSEIQGTPIRIEIGPRDLEKNQVTIIRRDTLEKELVAVEDVQSKISGLIEEIHNNLYQSALIRIQDNTVTANSYEEMKELIKSKKFVLVPFSCDEEDEKKIKEETTATTRCIPFASQTGEIKPCFYSGKPTNKLVIFARSY